MPNKQKKTENKTSQPIPNTAQLANRYAGVAQLLALASVVLLIILRGFVSTLIVPDYVIIGLLGLAVGLGPEQIGRMLTDVVKAFIGKGSSSEKSNK